MGCHDRLLDNSDLRSMRWVEGWIFAFKRRVKTRSSRKRSIFLTTVTAG
jgi:hypothetical protein